MKELSVKEKAKAYDEAIERAKLAHKDEDRHLKATLERIFPQLKESENENIRKRIIHALHGDVLDMEETTKAIAWLEKQSEQENKINFTFEDVLALECSMKIAKITKGGDELYKNTCPSLQ